MRSCHCMSMNLSVSRVTLSKMDTRVTLWLSASFFITLNLLLIGGGTQTENACTRTAEINTTVYMEQPNARLLCRSGQGVWRKGSDLCDLGSFTHYSSCSGFVCIVDRSVYISEPATYFCCGSEEIVDQYCYNIRINPILNVTVPPLLRAGREETLFVVVTAKPRPSVFPTLYVTIPDSNDSTNGTSDITLTASRRVATRSEEPLKYFVFYTFNLPRIEQESAHAVLSISLPSDQTWTMYNHSVSDSLTYPVVNIIPAPPVETTTTQKIAGPTTDSEATDLTSTVKEILTTEAPPVETTTTQEMAGPTTDSEADLTSTAEEILTTEDDGFRTTPTSGVRPVCNDNGVVIGAAVGSGMATAILSVIATVVIVFLCKQRSRKKFPEDKSHRPAPSNLQLDKPIMNGHIIEPTPTKDDVGLILSESGRRIATSPLVSSEPRLSFIRLQSRGSNSPTTPMTEFDPLLSQRTPGVIVHNEVSAAAAASGPMRCPVVEGENDGDDPRHVYSEIKTVMVNLPPSKRPLPETPPPFLCLGGQPPRYSDNPHTLTFVHSQPGSDEGHMDSTYSREGVKIKLEPELLSPESAV